MKDIGRFYLQISLEDFWTFIQILIVLRRHPPASCNRKPQTTNNIYIEREFNSLRVGIKKILLLFV